MVGSVGRLFAFALAACLVACGATPSGTTAEDGVLGEDSQTLDQPPTITRLAPAGAVQGTVIAISGAGFVDGASVSFNGTPSSNVTFVNSRRLNAVVPDGCTTGPVTVAVPAGSVTSATNFQVLPKVTDLTPLRAFIGETLTITGSGFTGTTAVKVGVLSTTFNVVSDFSITASVPPGTLGGKATVTTPSGSATSTTSMLVLPLISGFSPTEGPIGASVSITGEGFSQASAVKFGPKPATFSIVGDTEITAIVPVGAATSKITVETPQGNRTSAPLFTVIPAPAITSFTPLASELPATLTINGRNFISVSAVAIGSIVLPSFTYVSSKQLTALIPPGTLSGKVSVVNPAGTAVSSATFTSLSCSDVDGDSVCDRDDRCPGYNDLVDSDADGLADGCDVCPSAGSAGQACGPGVACNDTGACNVEQECSFSTQGPGVLQGSVVIDDVDTAGDVAQLADKWCVGGDVIVTTTDFTDLSALSGLVEVGGSLIIGGTPPNCSFGCASGNQLLTSVHGLEGLRAIGGTLELREDPRLGSLAPLVSLKRLGNLTISNTAALTDLRGLEGVQSLHWLFIEYADGLSSLAGLENLTLASMINLNNMPALADISALSHITALPEGFQIVSTGLASLHGIDGLTSVVSGGVQLAYNPNITDLSPLSSLRTTGGLLLQGHGITSLLPLSNLTSVSSLTLWDIGASSLDGLGGITTTLMDLQIVQNQALTSMAGLGNLQVQGRVKLSQNPALVDCGAASILATSDVDIENNDALSSLSCLAQSTQLRQLTLIDDPSLLNLEDLAALTNVEGSLTLGNDDDLTSLTGLEQLQTAGGIDIAYTNLTDLRGLEGLTTTGSLSLRHNLQLGSLSALAALTEVSFWLSFESNFHLTQCEIANLEAQLGRPADFNVDNGPSCDVL
jgi:hypothetical protein